MVKKNKEIILYLAFGVATTLVNFVVFWALEQLLGTDAYLVNNVIAWVAAVAFAYVTNKLFVFQVNSWDRKVLAREVPEFLGARVLSLVVEELGLLLLVELLKFGEACWKVLGVDLTGTLVAKVLLAVVVVVMNYFFSKFLIFKKK